MDHQTVLNEYDRLRKIEHDTWHGGKDPFHIEQEKMAPQDFLKYAASNPMIREVPAEYKDHPMCPGCEKIALRDRGWNEHKWAQCPSCNRRFQAEVSLYEYMQDKLYRR